MASSAGGGAQAQSLLERVGRFVAETRWSDLKPATRDLAPLVLLDAAGCGLVGARLGVLGSVVDDLANAGGAGESSLWGRPARLPAAHAALANGAVAHHVELDDGDSRASLHGGVTVVPAAVAVAEAVGATGRALLEAVAVGYAAAVAAGAPLKAGVDRRLLHGPVQVGCLGAAAAAARLYRLGPAQCTDALAIAAELMPFGPFEAFSKGAPIKDFYGGWPAYVGVLAADLARGGLGGCAVVIEKPRDGLGTFLSIDRGISGQPSIDADELCHVYFKPYSSCRATHPTLTALEQLKSNPVDAREIESVLIETYPFAVDLNAEAVSDSAIGARTSLHYCAASMILDGELLPEAFTASALADPRRRALEAKIRTVLAADMVEPLVRGSRVTLRMSGGAVRRVETRRPRWDPAEPATRDELVAKFRRLAGASAARLESAIFGLAGASNLAALSSGLGVAV